MMYNIENCKLFANAGNTSITFLEGITATEGSNSLSFDVGVDTATCYNAINESDGFDRLVSVTGIVANGKPTVISGMNMDIFWLTLDGSVSE